MLVTKQIVPLNSYWNLLNFITTKEQDLSIFQMNILQLQGYSHDAIVTPRNTPRELCMLGDTGNKRAVRILLECILVIVIYLLCIMDCMRYSLIVTIAQCEHLHWSSYNPLHAVKSCRRNRTMCAFRLIFWLQKWYEENIEETWNK